MFTKKIGSGELGIYASLIARVKTLWLMAG